MTETPTKSNDKVIALTAKAFKELSDYSCTLPTGTVMGKRWKRRRDYHDASKGWVMGEYVPCNIPGEIGIQWRDIVIVDCE